MRPVAWTLFALVAAGAAAILLTRLPPRRALAAVVMAVALGLAAGRQFALALPLVALGLGLWRSAAPDATSAQGQRSEVRTPSLAMTLDHDSGEIDGEVLAGPFTGARLSDLTQADLQRLVAQLDAAGDEDGLSLLLAYLDRRHGPEPEGPPPDGATMSRADAYRILGLPPGAGVAEVRAAHRRLMKRVHPDLGGSSALAAMINAAKELLDPGPNAD